MPQKQNRKKYIVLLLNIKSSIEKNTLKKISYMGAQCLSTTPNEVYSKYFQRIKITQLKNHWSTVKVYKIKKLYDKFAQKHPYYSKHTHLPYEVFANLFPQLRHYQQIHKKRIFQIFDKDNQGFLDWNNFYSGISICYYSDNKTLGTLIFMMFDEILSKELTKEQLKLMIQLNQSCIIQKIENDESIPMFQPDDILNQLLSNSKNCISIDQWLQKMEHYFDINRFRNIFNIFIQEKLQKQLVQNFNQWNSLYNEKEERYISYLISYKWFQSWKIYVLQAYGKALNQANTKNPTTKTIKTKKNFKSVKELNSMKKIANPHHLRQLKFKEQISKKNAKNSQNNNKSQVSDQEIPSQVKNYDFIHGNIGQRPKQIYNNVLEGEFQEILKPQLIENRDYVLVSEKVWISLKAIYGGFPEFRRTGYDFIELYPKVLRIYSQLFKGKIDYSSQILRQVSSYLTVKELLTKSIEIQEQNLKEMAVFYKTIDMPRWEQITDLTYMFTQITPEIIIFLTYIDKNQVQQFKKNHQRVAKQIIDVNVGDKIVYRDNLNSTKTQKNVHFMGKNNEGKYNLHLTGQSYIYDFAVTEADIIKKGAIINPKNVIQDVKLKKKMNVQYIGIPNTKGIGYINSVILQLFAIKGFRQNISFVTCNSGQISKIIQVLAHINSLISAKKKVDARDILDMIQILLSDFQNFEIGMSYSFLNEFMRKIQTQFKQIQLKDIIKNDFQFKTQKSIQCGKCKQSSEIFEENLILTVSIPENSQKYYEVIYVPYCQQFKPVQIKRYGFTLPQNSTFKNYKQVFQKLADITNQKYIMTEVYNNNIIKNYSNVKDKTLLSHLHLRDTDVIYAFELCTNFDRFIDEHYTNVKDIASKDFKVDQFIDCKNQQKGWIFGKISEVKLLSYTHKAVFKVIHKFSKNQQWQVSYDLQQDGVASFPSKSYLNAQQYHLRLLQRYFSEPSNEMQLCNIPLIVVLTNWMRWKEFYYLVYLQIKRFIAEEHKFKDQDEAETNMQLYSTKSLHPSSENGKSPKNKIFTKKIKLNKFKEYLYGQNFPYVLNFVDRDGRCALCFKFLKTKVFKGQMESYCEGCTLSCTQPISWQIKASDVMVCIDWKGVNKMKKNIVKDHSSYANLLTHKKNDIQNLQNCVNNKLNQSYYQQSENLCCSTLALSNIREKILNNPNNLIIYLERVLEQDGFKKINNKQVNFDMQEYKFNGQIYKLVGITSIFGGNKNIQYKTYVLKSNGEWIEYDGQAAKVVKKSFVQKVCAFTLYYSKKTVKKSEEEKQIFSVSKEVIQSQTKNQQIINQQNRNQLQKIQMETKNE